MNSSDMENGDGNEYGLDASPASTNNEIGMAGAGEGKTAGKPLTFCYSRRTVSLQSQMQPLPSVYRQLDLKLQIQE